MIMVQMYMHEMGMYWRLLDGPQFVELRNVLDNTMRQRTPADLGKKKSSDAISMESEYKLYEMMQLGEDDPQ